MADQRLSTVVLKSGRDESVRRSHPWIFSGAIDRLEGAPKSGQRVRVADAQGETLGVGHYFDANISVKMLTFGEAALPKDFFIRKLDEAVRLRSRLGLFASADTNAFRLVHGEGDGLPGVIIDLFKDIAVVEYHTAGMVNEQPLLIEAIREVLGGKVKAILARSDEISEWVWGDKISDGKGEILENKVRYLVNFEGGQKTGFFLDQRDSRKIVGSLCNGAAVLDCFSYTGSFGLNALMGGATSVTIVDASAPALEIARQNVELNFPNAEARFVKEDCLKYLHDLDRAYEVIVLDPPAFVKHRGALSGGIRGYETINMLAMKQIAKDGLLATFSCSQLVDREQFRKIAFKAAARAGRAVQVLGEFRQAACHPVSIFHPEGEYLKGLLLRVV